MAVRIMQNEKAFKTISATVGRTDSPSKVIIGAGHPIVIQTMCNTHTADVDASVAQCARLAACGAQMIRLTTQGMREVEALAAIRERLHAQGIFTPLVADVHFSADVALAVAGIADKVRINPGNFAKEHDTACRKFSELIEVCRKNGTAIRIGLNHGSLGERITGLYGDTPRGMEEAAMEWIRMCTGQGFFNVVVSLKSSNTLVMVQAYRMLYEAMKKEGFLFPMHLGVTEAGNGDSGRIKSVVGISSLLEDGIGDTIRVSLTEDPVYELPVAAYLARRYSKGRAVSAREEEDSCAEWDKAMQASKDKERETMIADLACLYGKKLLDKEIDDFSPASSYPCLTEEESAYLKDEIMQAARRRFYKPEYIACPGCGRTMYDLERVFYEVKRRTAHLKGLRIAVMGCIVNGPGEMADADWGYVGEGGGKVTIYKGKEPVLRHVPQDEAIDRLLELIGGI